METPEEPVADTGVQPQEPELAKSSVYVPPAPPAASTSIGIASLVGAGLAELLGVLILFSGCSAFGAADFLLVVATVALVGGGITSVVVGSGKRSGRGVGVTAIIAGVISLPINLLLVGLSGFCMYG